MPLLTAISARSQLGALLRCSDRGMLSPDLVLRDRMVCFLVFSGGKHVPGHSEYLQGQ